MPGPHRLGRAADGIGPKIWTHADRSKEVSVADAQLKIVGGPQQKNDPIRIAQAMTILMQEGIDVRYPITDLAPDDPVRLADPATERVFWEGANVIERPGIVTITHDGTDYVTHWKSL